MLGKDNQQIMLFKIDPFRYMPKVVTIIRMRTGINGPVTALEFIRKMFKRIDIGEEAYQPYQGYPLCKATLSGTYVDIFGNTHKNMEIDVDRTEAYFTTRTTGTVIIDYDELASMNKLNTGVSKYKYIPNNKYKYHIDEWLRI